MTTAMDSTHPSPANAARSERLSRRWLELCARHLPVAPDGSMWRYSRATRRGEPEQGWKLHVSATALNATRVLARVAPLLAGLVGRPDPSPWTTPAFAPQGNRARSQAQSDVYDDLYALGAVTYLLLTGRMPEGSPAATPISKLRRDAPPEVCALVEGLLDPCAQTQPDASAVVRRLQDSLARVSPSAASDPRVFAYDGGSFMTAAATAV